MKMVRRASCDEVTSLATRVCCLKGGVILPAGSLQSACLLNSEDGLLTFEFLLPAAAHGQQCPGCGWVSAYLPLRNLGHRAPFCDGCMDDLHLFCKSSGTPLPFAPPTGGVFGTSNHRDITTNRGWTIPVFCKLWPYGRAHLSGR